MRALKWLPWLLTAASVAITGVVAAQSGGHLTWIKNLRSGSAHTAG